MNRIQPRNGTCRACAVKVYKPEQHFRVLNKYNRKGWKITNLRLETNGPVRYEIYTLQRHEKTMDLYFDVTDFLRLI